MPSESRRDPRTVLAKYLPQFKRCRDEYVQLSKNEKRIKRLSRKLAKKEPKLRAKALEVSQRKQRWPQEILAERTAELRWKRAREAGYGIDPAELSRLTCETPEQKEIEQLRPQRNKIEVKFYKLRAKVRPPWQQLAEHNTDAKATLEEFDRLSRLCNLSNLDTIIGLLEKLSQPAAEAEQTVGGAAETAAVPTNLPIPRKKPGRKTDMDALEEFARVLAPYGDDWKKHVDEIFPKLDEAGVPIPKEWAKLKDLAVRTWEDGSAFIYRPAVQALEYRFKLAKKCFSQILASPAEPH